MENKVDTDWKKKLSQRFNSQIKFDSVTRQLYSTAACFYEITPLAVIIPESVSDIIDAVNICRDHQIPMLPRGAGTSLTGNSVGKAVILDLTRHFQDINDLGDGLVRAQVGVVLKHLQEKLKRSNKKFAPDPGSGNVCVIGGMLGNNSGGPHTLKHGNMFKHVEEISMVLSDGTLFTAKNIPLSEIPSLDDYHRERYQKVVSLLKKYKYEIEASRPRVTKNASGYQVWDILTDTHLNLASMMAGSEGTLCVFIDAVLRTVEIPAQMGIVSFYFDDLEKVGQAVRLLHPLGASAIEFVDRSFLEFAAGYQPELKKFLPENVNYLLFVEFEGDTIEDINSSFLKAIDLITGEEKIGEVGGSSTEGIEIEKIFKIRKAANMLLNKIPGENKPIPFVEDASVHPDSFDKFLAELSPLLDKYSFNYVAFGHAGNGNLHLRPLLNFKDKNIFNSVEMFMTEFVELVKKFNGSLSGEHGDGRLRTPFLRDGFEKIYPLFEEIKNLFDPDRLMNPDIIVPSKQYRWNDNLRYSPEYKYAATGSRIDNAEFLKEIEKCHGCGACREYCPVFEATGEEEATARAKANILRGIISGNIDRNEINSDHFFKIMDYCLNCGQCLTDCPTAVNIPAIAVAAKEKLYSERGYKINEKILQNGRLCNSISSTIPKLSNIALSSQIIRKGMDSLAGIHQKRILPEFYRKLKYIPAKKGERDKKIVLWLGCSAEYNDPGGEAKSSIEIFERLGFEVILPEWKCCGIAKITYGNINAALNDIDFNLTTLLPYAKKNIPIVFTSASCGYAIMHEYHQFIDDKSKINSIAKSSHDIHDFLYRQLTNGNGNLKFTRVNKRIVYHEPCHLKSQQNNFGPVDLINLIPGIELIKIEDSCCGIAGTFGMKKENFELSMKIGEPLFKEINRADPELILSGCGTCQIQIKQGAGRKVIHPITLLNQAAVSN